MFLRPDAVRPLVGYLLVLTICLGAVDMAVKASVEDTALLSAAAEINSPATVFAKIDALRRFRGLKVAVVGDSLIYGRSLQEHGIEPWRERNLTAAISQAMQSSSSGREVMVMNFGMNGITPSDLGTLVPLIMSAKPDLIFMDVTLRSFSRDFDDPNASARQWLTTIHISPQTGTLSVHEAGSPINSALSAFMLNHFYLYRIREIVQFALFEAQPKEFLTRVRDRMNAFLGENKSAPPAPDELMLQLKAQKRYAKVDLHDDNPQWEAYRQLLQALKTAKQKTVIFYATENPNIRESLIEDAAYQALVAKISKTTEADGDEIRFLGPLSELEPAEFLDHVHLTPSGYQVLAKRIADTAQALESH